MLDIIPHIGLVVVGVFFILGVKSNLTTLGRSIFWLGMIFLYAGGITLILTAHEKAWIPLTAVYALIYLVVALSAGWSIFWGKVILSLDKGPCPAKARAFFYSGIAVLAIEVVSLSISLFILLA